MIPVVPLARFVSTNGQVNKSYGVYLPNPQSLKIANIGYSFRDTNGVFNSFNSNYTGWESRLAIVEGKYGGDLAFFTIDTDLSGYNILVDTAVFNPADLIPFTSDQTPVQSGPGKGVSILLATPVLYGLDPPVLAVTARIYGSSGSQQGVSQNGSLNAGAAGAAVPNNNGGHRSTGGEPRSNGGGGGI